LFSPALDRLLLLLPPLLRAIQAPSTPLRQNNSSESEELKPIDSEMKSVLVLLRPIPDADVSITGRCRSYLLNLEVARAATSTTQAGQWIFFCFFFYRSYYWVTNDFSFFGWQIFAKFATSKTKFFY
jgi:hypothetical protein